MSTASIAARALTTSERARSARCCQSIFFFSPFVTARREDEGPPPAHYGCQKQPPDPRLFVGDPAAIDEKGEHAHAAYHSPPAPDHQPRGQVVGVRSAVQPAV